MFLVFFLGLNFSPAHAATLQNGGFESWSAGPDNWTIDATMVVNQISTLKTEGSFSANISTALSFDAFMYQGLIDTLSTSTSYTVSVDVRDASSDQYNINFCIQDSVPSFASSQINCDRSNNLDSFETLSVTKTTNGTGQLGYITFFAIDETSPLLQQHLNKHQGTNKPVGVADNANALVDNVVISLTVSEFNAVSFLLLPATGLILVAILYQSKKR